ncbi:hypothetical protein [Mucilaginibacter boryungensis]|uniref:DUF4919 domain-containing protein n=1 Tax=Mucilaginibacter boryungensis TaxID=768480 RepID=A0ABR9XNI0_9SPHI|nr:hypothetical protein [Mucilaginibacter boryungensis]MBE9668590.1 hypothetical protein [Mucilaginibacter boryungensis]
MKTAKLLILIVLLAGVVKAQRPVTKPKQTPAKSATTTVEAPPTGLPTDELFEHYVLKHADGPAPEGYGMSPNMLIPVGAYVEDLANQTKITAQLNRFLKTYLWADGSPLIYAGRTSKMINGVNVDIFLLTKTGGKDTVTLYTDLYKMAPVYPPKGFKFLTKEQLATEFAPVLAQLKAYYAMPDRYANPAAVSASFQLLSFMQSYVGLDYLMDKDYIGQLLNDVGVDFDLKAFLVRSFIFHRLEYEVTGQPNAKIKAYNAMVDDYQVAIKAHDIMLKGTLASYMVKK